MYICIVFFLSIWPVLIKKCFNSYHWAMWKFVCTSWQKRLCPFSSLVALLSSILKYRSTSHLFAVSLHLEWKPKSVSPRCVNHEVSVWLPVLMVARQKWLVCLRSSHKLMYPKMNMLSYLSTSGYRTQKELISSSVLLNLKVTWRLQ